MNREYISVKDELNQISPLISGINKGSQLEVPRDYFEIVEDQILSQISLPAPKVTLTAAPEGYLENLEGEIMKKVGHSDNSKKHNSNNSVLRLIFGAAIAACLGVFLISRLSFGDVNNNSNAEVSYESIDFLEAFPHDVDDINIDQLIDSGVIEEDDLSFVIGDETEIEIPEESFFESDAPF